MAPTKKTGNAKLPDGTSGEKKSAAKKKVSRARKAVHSGGEADIFPEVKSDGACPGENPEKLSEDFNAHLMRIKNAKKEADNLISKALPNAAQASLAITWELVFDHLCGVSSLSLAELNTLSGVIQKLSSAKIQLNSDIAQPAQNISGADCEKTVGEEALRRIEEKLKLL